ncbi:MULTISPECIES: hypothetical protein [unclassified Methylobacterium]|jgi:hypothetical protein|uniref:hypothetical protein n=1 Tax=unclassified Methylobacterium TaxID=2615210 RepID=UPI0005B9E6A3|nr:MULTISPECIES: hypothetical protein [unclassified Methylobacterium]KOX49155.1 hypothetical protein ADL19_20725 [Streptomyces purpurogeneiscleroticus]SFU85077.1 hypothetical protein SAMN02799643_02725 [Methylobacterium sp. UNCCL125]
MHALGRLILGAFALLLAVPGGFAVLVLALLVDPAAQAWLSGGALAGLDMALSDLSAGLPPEGLALFVAGLAKALFVLLFVPPALIGLGGEILGCRGFLWYGAGCGLLTAALPWLTRGALRSGGATRDVALLAGEVRLTLILFVVGASAGLVYWLVAGRGAGRIREADLSEDA